MLLQSVVAVIIGRSSRAWWLLESYWRAPQRYPWGRDAEGRSEDAWIWEKLTLFLHVPSFPQDKWLSQRVSGRETSQKLGACGRGQGLEGEAGAVSGDATGLD